MFTPNNAKDLMALACVAFQSKDYTGAGSLFAQAMSLHDSENFVDSLLVGNFTCAALASTIEEAENTDDPEGLASISATLSFNMTESFRSGLKESLMESDSFDELSESECSQHKSQSDEGDEDYPDELEDEHDDSDEDDFSEDDSDDDDFETESSVLFEPVDSPLSLT